MNLNCWCVFVDAASGESQLMKNAQCANEYPLSAHSTTLQHKNALIAVPFLILLFTLSQTHNNKTQHRRTKRQLKSFFISSLSCLLLFFKGLRQRERERLERDLHRSTLLLLPLLHFWADLYLRGARRESNCISTVTICSDVRHTLQWCSSVG